MVQLNERNYLDLALAISDESKIRLGVNNFLDKEPPMAGERRRTFQRRQRQYLPLVPMMCWGNTGIWPSRYPCKPSAFRLRILLEKLPHQRNGDPALRGGRLRLQTIPQHAQLSHPARAVALQITHHLGG